MQSRTRQLHPAVLCFALLACLLFSGLTAFRMLHDHFNWGDDWAQYLLQAKAIAEGQMGVLLSENAFMMHNSVRQDGPVAYPWGLPAILAAEGRLFGFDLLTFKAFNILFFMLASAAAWSLYREFVSEGLALILAAMIAFNPVLAHYSNHLMTELPFMAACLLALLAIERTPESRLGPLWSRLAIGALVWLAYIIRVNGALLLPVATFHEFLPGSGSGWKRPSRGWLLLPYASFTVLVAVWQRFFPGGGDSYSRLLDHITAGTLVTNLTTYPVVLFDFFTSGIHSGVAALALGPVVVLGAIRSWRRTGHLSLYFLATLALYIVWPEQGQGYRFMIPMTPLVALFLALGCGDLADRLGSRFRPAALLRLIPVGVTGVFFLASAYFLASGKAPQDKWHPYDAESTALFQWVRDNTPADAVFAFFKPRAFHLFTGRLSLTNDVKDLDKASYFIYTDERDWNEAQRSLEEYSRHASLELVYRNKNFRVFRIARDQTVSRQQ